jgi:hypothetical protein
VLEFIVEQIREVRVMMEAGEGKARDVQGVQRPDQRFRTSGPTALSTHAVFQQKSWG